MQLLPTIRVNFRILRPGAWNAANVSTPRTLVAGSFQRWPGGPIPAINETRDLGLMLYDFDYSDPQNITPTYFRAKLECGVINTRDCEVFR